MSIPYATPTLLREAVTALLDPITRWRYQPASEAAPVRVNATGVDHWVEHVGDVHLDPDGTAHPYVVSWTGPGQLTGHRAAGGGPYLDWSVRCTIAAGDPQRVRWAVDRVRAALQHQRLTGARSSPLRERMVSDMREDTTPAPPRWWCLIEYGCNAGQETMP